MTNDSDNGAPSWENYRDGKVDSELRRVETEAEEGGGRMGLSEKQIAKEISEDMDERGVPRKEDGEDENTTVELSVSVDVSGATETQIEMYEQFASIYEELFETFVSKNLDYGSSFTLGGELLSQRDGPFNEDPRVANMFQVFTRTGDKRNRFFEQAFSNGSDRVGEELGETAGDCANYWLMQKWLAEHYEPSNLRREVPQTYVSSQYTITDD